MPKEKVIGDVIEALPSGFFKIQLSETQKVLAHLSGKMRLYHIRILPGDKVEVELSEYDKRKGRIIRRL